VWKRKGKEMLYEEIVMRVEDFGFVRNRDMADAVVKAALGILASRLDEGQARKFTERLPDPLNLELLRGHQERPVEASFDDYVEKLAGQFKISPEDARKLVNRIFHLAKEIVGEEIAREMQTRLPPDWGKAIGEA
jgi:uncharacterized protein (DUF2267 family)